MTQGSWKASTSGCSAQQVVRFQRPRIFRIFGYQAGSQCGVKERPEEIMVWTCFKHQIRSLPWSFCKSSLKPILEVLLSWPCPLGFFMLYLCHLPCEWLACVKGRVVALFMLLRTLSHTFPCHPIPWLKLWSMGTVTQLKLFSNFLLPSETAWCVLALVASSLPQRGVLHWRHRKERDWARDWDKPFWCLLVILVDHNEEITKMVEYWTRY